MHRIRLRGPWEYSREGKTGRLNFPTTWGSAFEGARAPVQLKRTFGGPERIEPGDKVWLSLDLGRPAKVILNGELIGEIDSGPSKIDVTSRLQPRNNLVLTMEPPPQGERDEIILEAALLIEPRSA